MISVSLLGDSANAQTAVLYGKARRIDHGEKADIAHFEASELVLYQLTTRRLQAFLFRGPGTVFVPGVRPAVNLIAHGENNTQSRKLVRSVMWLVEHGFAPEHLSDALWLRISALLNKERYGVRELRRLLQTQH